MIHARTAISAFVALCAAMSCAQAFDEGNYPDWKGQWRRFESGPVMYDATKPRRGQEAPLTPDYQAIFEANLRDQDAGGQGIDPTYLCLSPGMPRIMSVYEPMEIVITPKTTHILIQHIHDFSAHLYHGRDWPKDQDPTFGGYSIGRWIDSDGDGRFDTLEVETRGLKGPRTYDSSGIPFHEDNQTILNERIFADRIDRNILYDVITSIDHALTHPWSVTKKYRRNADAQPVWRESVCSEENDHVEIAKEGYMLSADGYLMPTRANQPPPDLRYFKQPQK